MRRASDNPAHFVMVGHAENMDGTNQKVFLLKVDHLGNPLWCYSYGEAPALGRTFEQKLELRAMENDGYIVCGTVGENLFGRAGFLLRVDDDGVLQWMRFYTQPELAFNLNSFHEVKKTNEGFVVTGYGPTTFPPGPAQNSLDTLIMTTDAVGNPLWANQYANLDGNQGGESVVVLPQGYVVVGGHVANIIDARTTELIRVNPTGGLHWYKRIFGAMESGSHFRNSQIANGELELLPDGNLMFGGGDNQDAALLQFDLSGNFVMGKTFGFANPQWGTSFVLESDGGATLVGTSLGSTNYDQYVVRVSSFWESNCHEANLTPVVDSPPIQVVPVNFLPVNHTSTTTQNPVEIPLNWNETVLCQSSPCDTPDTISCSLVSGDITVTWGTTPITISTIEVRRNGLLIATLPGAVTSFTDLSPLPGNNTYSVSFISGNPQCPVGILSCSRWILTVIDDHVLTDLIFTPAKPISDTPVICWKDLLESKGRSAEIIGDFSEITPELGSALPDMAPIVWLSLGEFPDQYELTPEEGAVMAEYLQSGGSLYLEGGDVGFALPASLAELDGMIATDDGDPNGTVRTLIGLDSGVGLDLTAASAPYIGSGRSIDHLEPDGPGAGAIFMNEEAPHQITAVYYDAEVGGTGTHRVITSSTTLEGYNGDRSGLVDNFLEALSPLPPPGVEFVRTDCNADGNLDVGDAIHMLSIIFFGASMLCSDACDTNNDGMLDIADPISLLNYTFTGGAPPPPPFPTCGGMGSASCPIFPPCP